MKCFLLSRDLMFTSQASGAATAAGCETKTIGNADAVETGDPHIVVLDLTIPGLNIPTTVETLKNNQCVIVAVGPHVHEAKLEAARQSGCQHVITKGQASRELGGLLRQIVDTAKDE